MTKEYPTLFKKTATGAIQTWQVLVTDDAYRTKYGQEGGTITVSEPTICKGKQGRSDEEQALFEAEALHTRKLKKDYVKTREEALVGGSSELIEGGILPMLAHKFSEHGDKLVYPCYAQPKLDGHRCEAQHPGGGEQSYGLWSRTRKPILSMRHIVHELDWLQCGGLPFDGELYNHAYRAKFEELTHFIRQSKPAAGCEIVQYHIYDMPIPNMTYRKRLDLLRRTLFSLNPWKYLQLVETREVQNEDELMLAFEDFLAQGYEGAIARNADGLYVNKRSYDLLKIKQFLDSEYKVIGMSEGVGKMAGHGVFVCHTNPKADTVGFIPPEELNAFINRNPGAFTAAMKCDMAQRAEQVRNYVKYLGLVLTVKYQGITNKNKVPRFPVALRIRED